MTASKPHRYDQADAAINASNSAQRTLVNAAGEVIGINTATSSDADGIGIRPSPFPASRRHAQNRHCHLTSCTGPISGACYSNLTPDVARSLRTPRFPGRLSFHYWRYKRHHRLTVAPPKNASTESRRHHHQSHVALKSVALAPSTLIGEFALATPSNSPSFVITTSTLLTSPSTPYTRN